MNIKQLVFIESNTTGTGELLIKKALKKGFNVIFITCNEKKYSFLPMDKVKIVNLDTSNISILYSYVAKIENLVGIYSNSDNYVEITSILGVQLKLPGTSPQSIRLCRNKYFFYQLLESKNIDSPQTQRINNTINLDAILNSAHFPVVIKPEVGTGSIGVKLCTNKINALQHINLLLKDSQTNLLIQEYIDAPEYSVEVCTVNDKHHILGITQKYLSSPPYFIEIGHDFPAILPSEDESKVEQVIKKLLSAINFNFGFSHIELKIKKDEIFIIEANPRLAGGMIPVLIEKATGMDILDKLIDLYTNQPANFQITQNKYSSIRHFIPKMNGKIKYINFANKSSVDEVKLVKNTGDYFSIQGDFRDRLAYIIATDSDATLCKEKADQALKNFEIEMEC